MAKTHSYNSVNSGAAQALGWVVIVFLIISMYGTYKLLEPPNPLAEINSQAYVTLLTDAKDIIGLKVLAFSLNKVKSTRKFVVMVTDSIPDTTIDELKTNGFKIARVKVVTNNYDRKPGLHDNEDSDLQIDLGNSTQEVQKYVDYTKVMTWELSYSKVIFLSPSCIVLDNIDELFQIEKSDHETMAAVGDCCDLFDSNVFLTVPSRRTLANMLETIKRLDLVEEESEESFLNSYFPIWKPIQFIYNVQQSRILSVPHKSWKMEKWKVICYNELPPWQIRESDKLDIKSQALMQPWYALHTQLNHPDPYHNQPL